MNTLDDLRATMNREADRLGDPDRHARPVAVRERIRVVRRRRRGAAAATALALVVAASAGVTALERPDRRVEPASQVASEVAGVRLPRDISVLGFAYRLSGTDPMADGVRLAWRDDWDDHAMILVGSGLGSGSATLYSSGEAVARIREGQEIASPVPIGGDQIVLDVRLHGTPAGARAGVAFYQATKGLPDGVDNGHQVFRSKVAGSRLITGAFADPGTAETTIRFSGRLDRTSLSAHCDARGAWLNVTIDGERFMQGACQDVDGRDAGTSGYRPGSASGGAHVVEAYLTDGEDGPRVTTTDGTLGIAAYATEPPATRLLGTDVDRTVEYAGRTWTIERAMDRHQATVDTADGDRLLAFLGSGDRTWTTWRGRLDRGTSSSVGGRDTGSAAFLVSGVLLAGDRYDVRLLSEGAGGDGALLVYRPV